MVHTKIFFLDFDNDSYAQNSEIIKTIRIQKNFFKIPIGKFFENCQNPKKKYLCVPHMWYTIPHLRVKATTYAVYYTTYVVYYTTNVYSPEIPILFKYVIVINEKNPLNVTTFPLLYKSDFVVNVSVILFLNIILS